MAVVKYAFAIVALAITLYKDRIVIRAIIHSFILFTHNLFVQVHFIIDFFALCIRFVWLSLFRSSSLILFISVVLFGFK